MKTKFIVLLGCALPALSAPTLAENTVVADTGTAEADAGQIASTDAHDIIVNGQIVFRNRTEDPNPVLSYDLEYFQRFEPVSVGEMLKRVPGVTFTSDRSEEHTSELQSLMRISYAVFCLKKKTLT